MGKCSFLQAPPKPSKVDASLGQKSRQGSVGPSADDGDELQIATALSLSMVGGSAGGVEGSDEVQQAIALSLLCDPGASSSSRACQQTPDFVDVHLVPPNGWCFYDCVLRHLLSSSEGYGEMSTVIVTSLVVVACACHGRVHNSYA